MSWTNPEYATSFYHLSRHPEIVTTKDRDVFAFFPDTVTLAPTNGMGIYRDATKATLQWKTTGYPPPPPPPPPTSNTSVSERLLLWGRVGGTEVASAFRWTPYVNAADTDTQTIKPLREVFAPRVIYDRTSNAIHLWFWTNVNWAYNGSDYDESQLYPINTSNYNNITGTVSAPQSKAKRVLCYSVGRFEHSWVEGGYVGGYTESLGPDTRYDLIPVFNRPKIITNYSASSGTGPGIVTDGWYDNSSSAFLHQWKTTVNATYDTNYDIAAGDWMHNETEVYFAGLANIDPKSTYNIIPVNYTGNVYNYAFLDKSDKPSAVTFFPSGNKIETIYPNTLGMLLHISTVTYTGGKVTNIDQHQVGGHSSDCELSNPDNPNSFGLSCSRSGTDSFTLDIGAGIVQVRGTTENSVAGTSLASFFLPKKVWVEYENYTQDRSLIPSAVTIKTGANFPPFITYQRYFHELYDIDKTTTNLSNGGSSIATFVGPVFNRHYQGGEIREDWVRPDGQLSGLGGVDADYPNGRTIDFVSAGPHQGELQDRQFHEQVVDNVSTRFGSVGDQGISYFVQAATIVAKEYARIDSVNASSGRCGKSLEIKLVSTDAYLQLYDFYTCSTVVSITAPSALSENLAAQGYSILARSSSATMPVLSYLGLQKFKPDTCGTADTAKDVDWTTATCGSGTFWTFFSGCMSGHCTDFYTLCPPPKFNHSELTDIAADGAGDDHNGDGTGGGGTGGNHAYIGNHDSYARNKMTNGLGDLLGNASVQVDSRILKSSTGVSSLDWENCQLVGSVASGTPIQWSVAASTIFKILNVTPADYTTGAGALVCEGGGLFKETTSMYRATGTQLARFIDGTSVAYLTDSTGRIANFLDTGSPYTAEFSNPSPSITAKLASGSVAGYFTYGARETVLCDATHGVDTTEIRSINGYYVGYIPLDGPYVAKTQTVLDGNGVPITLSYLGM